MITHLTLRNLRRLRCENSIAEQFVGLVTQFLSNGHARKDEIGDELFLLIDLCNHHRATLWQLYRDGATDNRHLLKTWLYEIATPPSGEWAELRFSLTPFIRTFGRLPRPRGTALFSPVNGVLREAGLSGRESGPSGKPAVTSARDEWVPDAAATTGSVSPVNSGLPSYVLVQGGGSGSDSYSMTSGSGTTPQVYTMCHSGAG